MFLLWLLAVSVGAALSPVLLRAWPSLTQGQRSAAYALCIACTAVSALTNFTAWSFRSEVLQAACVLLGVALTTLLLIVASVTCRKSLSRATVLLLFILLAFCANDAAWMNFWRYYPVESERHLSNELVLRRFSGGFAGADWEGVTILRQPRKLPLLENTLYSEHIGDAKDCNDFSVHVELDDAAHVIHVQCGDELPLYWSEDVKVPPI